MLLPLNHPSNLKNTNTKLKAEIAALQEAARKVSYDKQATEQKLATEALESENSALQKEVVHLRSRVADLESKLLLAEHEVEGKSVVVPETSVIDHTETVTSSHNKSQNPVNGDGYEDDDTSMMIGVQQYDSMFNDDTITPPEKFGAENEVNELKLRLEDRDREVSALQKAVNTAEKERASADELVCNVKNVLLKENLEEGGNSVEILVTKLLDTLEAEKESCRRMEVENTKLRGQVSKVVFVIDIPWKHRPFFSLQHLSLHAIFNLFCI